MLARRVTLGNFLHVGGKKTYFLPKFLGNLVKKKLGSSPASGKQTGKNAQFQSSILFWLLLGESESTQYFEILVRNTKSKHLRALWGKRARQPQRLLLISITLRLLFCFLLAEVRTHFFSLSEHPKFLCNLCVWH